MIGIIGRSVSLENATTSY